MARISVQRGPGAVFLWVGVLLLGWAAAAWGQPPVKPLALGVKAPAADPEEVRKVYAPFVKILGQRLGQEVVLEPHGNTADLGRAVQAAEIDFLLLSPTDYLEVHAASGAEAIASKLNKGGTPYCQGTIVTRRDSGIESIADLKGKRFQFGPLGTFNKYWAALAALMGSGLDAQRDVEVSGYGEGCDGIADCVLRGESDAGVICDYSWDGWTDRAEGQRYVEELKVLGAGPRLRDDAVAVAPHLGPDQRHRLVNALLSLDGEDALLAPPLKAKGFAVGSDTDYDELRSLMQRLDG
ncbi:MAG: phosphate/phosphite/phosphonate ABC transporter substrate-binding protein [Deferrisomatales bacterium]|nr:phosphate/phosphite/phosphonate ABC transporter substrate-binding protein [Deferrisomatales bacterium]